MPASSAVLELFHPLVRRWFGEKFAAPTDAQARAWPLIAAGEHVLVSAPTGSGKTLIAFLAAIDNLLRGRWSCGGVRALYLSPLKALNSDVRRNLLAPLDELRALFAREGQAFPPIRVLTRSGDTPDDERRAMLRHPPEILITTPESLNLMLTGSQSRRLFGELKTVILDEIHALAASKRGTYMMSAVERLAWSAGEFQRIALSATVRPAATVAAWMAGFEVEHPGPDARFRARPVQIVEAKDPRPLALTLQMPDVPPAQGLTASELWWEALTRELKAIVARNPSTLIFANSRREVEKIARLLNTGEAEPIAYSHHGSLSRELRLDVEERMKQGRLRAVVATGSLELGIDIGSVAEVVLVGTPPSVAQSLQRIGRADHRVGGTSRATLFALHGLDAAQAAAMAGMLVAGELEELRPVSNPLDVLAQVLLSMGCGVTWELEQLFARIRGIAAYHELPRRHFDLVVAMLAGRYADAPVRELKPRALVDGVNHTFTARKGTEYVLYQSGGTIPDRGYFHLRLADSKAAIGELDEEFVWERKLGDQFSLGTQTWRILDITHNDVEVGPADPSGPMIPFWKAEERNRSTQASLALLDFFDTCEAQRDDPTLADQLVARHDMDAACARNLVRFLARQREVSGAPLPGRRRIVVEHAQDASTETQQAIVHTFWGGRVNRPLAIALGEAWERRHGSLLECFATNDQILVMLPGAFSPAELFDLVTPRSLPDLLRAGLEKTSLFGARFRENSGRALLLPRGDGRRRYPLWLNRLRSKKLLGAVLRFPDFPIVVETWRDLLEDEMELDTLATLLDELAAGTIALHVVRPPHATPFADGVVYRQTNYHMYLDDAAGAAARSQLAEDLVGDLFRNASGAPAVPRALAELLASKLLRTHPDYRPTTRQEILLAVRETPLLPRAVVEDWLAQLSAEEREVPAADPLAALVSYRLPGATDELAADRADLPRVLFLRGTTVDALGSLRPVLGADADAVVTWLREHPYHSDSESAATLIGEYLRGRAVVTASELAAALGWPPRELGPYLDELLEGESIVSGQLLEGSTERGFCDAENADRLLRLRRAAQRGEAERALAARPLAELPCFLADWQGLARAQGGLEALQSALDRLFGFPAPAELWETALLPSRMEPYYPSWLDTLCQSYGLGWLGCGRQKATLAFPSDQALFVDRAALADEGTTAGAVVRCLGAAPQGLGFFELAEATGLATATLTEALWDLAWAGVVASDSFETVRRGVLGDFTAVTAGDPGARGGFRRWERSRPSAGRWHVLPVSKPAGPIESAELDKERARIVLARYGVVFRELLEHELPPLRWPRLFRTLRLLELSGEIVAGHFFAGVPGLQFATHEAIRRLAGPLPSDRLTFLNACDPASPCGLGLPGLPAELPRRLPGTWLVMVGSELVAVLLKGGRELLLYRAPDDGVLPAAVGIYRFLLGREFDPLSSMSVETINGESAATSPYADVLRGAGFANDYRGLSLWKR